MAEMRKFDLPGEIRGVGEDRWLGTALVTAWRTDGAFLVADEATGRAADGALAAGRRFFSMVPEFKELHRSDLTYSGYVAAGEEVSGGDLGRGGRVDYAETFFVYPDVPLDDLRVRDGWPGHGPVPWPDAAYREATGAALAALGGLAERVLTLIALGLDLAEPGALCGHAENGWHHLRVHRLPAASRQTTQGTVPRTGDGLVTLFAQDAAGGLAVSGPARAGRVHAPSWRPVRPVQGTLAVVPGALLAFHTDDRVRSVPHRIGAGGVEQFGLAYEHAPGFCARVRPLGGGPPVHYGSRLTEELLRRHPERITTRRILADGRLAVLDALRERPAPLCG